MPHSLMFLMLHNHPFTTQFHPLTCLHQRTAPTHTYNKLVNSSAPGFKGLSNATHLLI